MANCFERLKSVQTQIETLERKSSTFGSDAESISVEDLRAIRHNLHALSTDLEVELQSSHQSYRPKQPLTVNTAASEEKNDAASAAEFHNDDTFEWLDENYGGKKADLVSPIRSPFDHFKLVGKVVRREVKVCHSLGLDPQDIRASGWARLSTGGSSAYNICSVALQVPKVASALAHCWDLDTFDIFELAEVPEVQGHILVVFGSYLSSQFTWIRRYHCNLHKFHNFLMSVQLAYNDVPYHSKIHAADVAHTMMHFCKTSVIATKMTQLDQLAAFFAAVVHDVGHTGQTNTFHINSGSELAIRYNDRSVLENFHIATAFQILREKDNNFLDTLRPAEFKYVRETVIELVLGTDLHFHQKQLSKLQQLARLVDRDEEPFIDFKQFDSAAIPRVRGVMNEKLFMMEIALHLSDIANPTKKLTASIEWTNRITSEFYKQGDMERSMKLPISPGCDRSTNVIANQALAFIDFIVSPLWEAYLSIDVEAAKFIKGIERSRAYWQSQL